MSLNQIIWRNLKKNLKHYYLYIFALVFIVALYFAFVTLQYDPSMDEVEGTIKGAASIKAASVLLVAIVTIFLLYANSIFIKRRSKEIGLFQLIGLTKTKIFRILSIENFLLYFGSLAVGIFVGFTLSKLLIMVLFAVTGVQGIASLHFSGQALIQTLVVFGVIHLLIMLTNYLFIKKQSILSLFRVVSSAEQKVKKMSGWEIMIGMLGIVLILSGYYISSRLFSGDFNSATALFLAMTVILAFVIIGTYFFYKGSVSFLLNAIRKQKHGYLNVYEVLSLSSIMFRMKANALLLTIITTVSALAIGLLSLSYISYYSAEQSAKDNLPANFVLSTPEDAEQFAAALAENGIDYTETRIEVLRAEVRVEDILIDIPLGDVMDSSTMELPVVSETAVANLDIAEGEAYFTGYNDIMRNIIKLKGEGQIELTAGQTTVPLHYLGMRDDFIISYTFTSGGLPTAIVDDSLFQRLKSGQNDKTPGETSLYIGIDVADEALLAKADTLFAGMFDEQSSSQSRQAMISHQKQMMGLVIFIVGFLGLSFLVTSGCILYIKQMNESEDEVFSYTILRKLGFTQWDLLKGIQAKQLFNFGIPLLIGLSHSYFAVQSGWFFFGTELWAPMIIVMLFYTALYSIFGVLSVLYSKKVIRDAL
ncbi:FtsX-like permease family protein [Brevibacillus sp. TJ4]|uniref:FtsX-like permease family protein n=1 Tax=Brevibacillus sp. TJ4 TaxID=3234853 RepID=UPI0037D9191F